MKPKLDLRELLDKAIALLKELNVFLDHIRWILPWLAPLLVSLAAGA